MIDMLELVVAATALAWLVMFVATAFFYLKIDQERREVMRIKEKIDFNEESVKKITGFFIAIKSGQSVL